MFQIQQEKKALKQAAAAATKGASKDGIKSCIKSSTASKSQKVERAVDQVGRRCRWVLWVSLPRTSEEGIKRWIVKIWDGISQEDKEQDEDQRL